MNKLDQIKHNLEHGLPIDREETLNAIKELEQERDEAVAHCELLKETMLAEAHGIKRFYRLTKIKLTLEEVANKVPKQSLAEIQAKAIEEFLKQITVKLVDSYNPHYGPHQYAFLYNDALENAISFGETWVAGLRKKAKEQQ